MKILILTTGDESSLGWSYKRAFDELGHFATVINPNDELNESPLWMNRFVNRLFERWLVRRRSVAFLPRILNHSADVIFVMKGAWASPWLWKAIKAKQPHPRLVCYNADNPLVTFSRGGNVPWVTESIGCFDLYCTYNARLVQPLIDAGAKDVLRIPFAWDPFIHPMTPVEHFDHDVLFVGNGDRHRGEWLGEIFSHPATSSWRVGIVGSCHRSYPAHLKALIVDRSLYCAEMASAISHSKVVLNILREQNEGTHNMRTFEAPGCAGLMASQYSEEQDEFFKNDRAAIYFTDPSEAVEKIGDVLANEKLRRQMRNRASENVRNHTYTHRATEIIRWCDGN